MRDGAHLAYQLTEAFQGLNATMGALHRVSHTITEAEYRFEPQRGPKECGRMTDAATFVQVLKRVQYPEELCPGNRVLQRTDDGIQVGPVPGHLRSENYE